MESAAYHEAGHVVMDWIELGRCAGCSISTDRPGTGLANSVGGMVKTDSAIRIYLAGIAAEFPVGDVDFSGPLSTLSHLPPNADLVKVAQLLESTLWRGFKVERDQIVPRTLHEAVHHWFALTREKLFDYFGLVVEIAEGLIEQQCLSARDVWNIIRRYERAMMCR